MAKKLLLDVTLRNAKPDIKDKRLNDGEGLYLLIKTNGAKWWRFDYSFAGKRKTLSLGVYPKTTLTDARRKATEAQNKVANGIDPSDTRKDDKAKQQQMDENKNRLEAGLTIIGSFEHVARQWHSKHMSDKAESHQKKTLAMLQRDIFPWLGATPINEIKAFELLKVVERIGERGAQDTAHRALQTCGQIFRYAITQNLAERDITPDLKGAMPTAKGGNFAAVTKPQDAARLLRAIDAYEGTFVVKSALMLAPMVFVRPGELRQAEWEHIDLDTRQWCFHVTKTDVDHIVPLSNQAIAILEAIKPLTGHGRYVFPSARTPNGSRPMSDVALLAALRRMGIGKEEASIHGFRAMARTILDEVLGHRVDFIEHQLAHAVRDPNGRAYNRTAHLPARHKMMQSWSDYLDSLKNGAQVIAFKKTAN